MRQTLAILISTVLAIPAGAQNPPTPLTVAQYPNITAGSVLDIAGTYPTVDNRSGFTRHNDYHSYYATGVGTWSVSMVYADGTPTNWVSFGSTAVVNQSAPSSGIGFGLGYHDYVAFIIVGNATVQYSASKGYYLAPAVSAVNYPINANQGGTGSSNSSGWASNLAYQDAGAGSVAVPMQTLLGQTVSPLSFGAVCNWAASGPTPHDDTTAIQTAINTIANRFYGGIVIMPPSICSVTSTIDVPGSVRLKGQGTAHSGIAAIAGFVGSPTGLSCVVAIVPVVLNPTSLGCNPPSYATYGASIEDMTINGNGFPNMVDVVGVAMEELTYLANIALDNYTTGGVLMGGQLGGIQNTKIHGITGGPYSGACGPLIIVSAGAGRFSVSDVSGTSYPTFCDRGMIENSSFGGNYHDIHCENFFTCFGDVNGEAEVENVYGLGNVKSTVYQCGGPGPANGSTTMICLSGAGLLAKHVLANPSNGYDPSTALLVDDIHHVVICNGYPASGSPCGPFPLSYQFAVDSVLNLYDSQAPGVSSGNNLITSNATITQQIANIFMTGNLTVQGTLSPGGVGFGWPKPNPTSPPYGLGGTVFVFGGNNPNGLLFQGQSTIGNGTAAGGGLQVMGNGVQADPSYGMIGAGLTGDGATFVQRAPTTATLLQLYDGTFQFFATQSLTSGNIGNNLNGLLPVAFQLLPPATFLNLGNPVQSTYRYCTDCTTTSTTNPTCAGGGPGDAAIFTGAGWRCL